LPVTERAGRGLGLAQTVERAWQLHQGQECVAKFDPEIDRLGHGGGTLGQVAEGAQRLFEIRHGLPVGSSPHGLGRRLGEVRDGLRPPLAAEGVPREALDLLS
jgi:hypothetical protein